MYGNRFIDLVHNKLFHIKPNYLKESIYIYTWLSLIVDIAPEDFTLHYNIVYSIAFHIIMHYIFIVVCKLSYIIIYNIKHYIHYITIITLHYHGIL